MIRLRKSKRNMKSYSTKIQIHQTNSFNAHLDNTIDQTIRQGNSNMIMSTVRMESLKKCKGSTVEQGKIR